MIISIVILLIDLIHFKHGREHLLPLGCTEINAFLIALLEFFALDQSANLDVVFDDQASVGPVSSLYPFHDHHTLLSTQLIPALCPIVVECLLSVQFAILNW